jgi:hypothetical protein
MPTGESDYNPSQSESPHFEDKESHSPSGDSTVPQAQLRMLERLRRVPRSRWLLLAVIVLVSASLLWYRRLQTWDTRQAAQIGHSPFLSASWWSDPVVYNPDAALPEISGRVFGVAVQKLQTGERIWVVGANGFLAYSDDNGFCWTRFDYHPDPGVFREVTPNPCPNILPNTPTSQPPSLIPKALLHWPQLLPTVYAEEAPPKKPAAQQQSQNPAQQSAIQSPAQQGPAQQGQRDAPVQEQQQPLNQQVQQSFAQQPKAKSPIWVSPRDIEFGAVTLRQAAIPTKFLTISNLVDRLIRVRVGELTADVNDEFQVDSSKCDQAIGPKESCTIGVLFNPRTEGKKDFAFSLETDYSSASEKIYVHAVAIGVPAANSGKPPAQDREPPKQEKPKEPPNTAPPAVSTTSPPNRPRAPATAPDLLAISFFLGPIGRTAPPAIVSTGGAIWTQDSNGEWTFQPQTSGSSIESGLRTWTLSGPPSGGWANETRKDTATSLTATDARLRNRIELRWDPNNPGTTTGWSDYGKPSPKTTATTWLDSQLRSAAFDSNGKTWVAGWSTDQRGEHAVLARFDESIRTWQPLTRGALPADRRDAAPNNRAWMWMPRWYLAMLLLSLALAAPALLPPLPVQPPGEQDSVEGRLSSDKPLDPGDRDVLGLTEIALGLSAFLRNEKTLPPLTIAINGEWGTGKSSLMNLLRRDLQSYGMCPVWFNAWHHQKEEHLLAALLQTIKLEAVPPLWNLLGVPFRARLVAYRLRRRWPALVVAAAAATFLVMLDYHFRIHDHKDLFQWLVNQIVPSLDVKSNATTTLPVQGGFIALVTAITALWKGLTAFGANPASLLASVAQGNKMKDLEAQTSFRQRFAEEFRDFTTALGNSRPLVIFIDDLDRCLPGNVRDVLEAVNFLVSSGDCFIVLGMDRVQVQRAVGLSFKEVAEEASSNHTQRMLVPAVTLTPQAIAEAAAEAAREKRAEFAQKYLEKLVNLEVRVPLAEDDEVKQGLFAKDPPPKPVTLKEKSLRVGLKSLRWAIPAALVVLLLWGSYHYSLSAEFAVERWIAENPEPSAAAATALNPPPASRANAAGPVSASAAQPVAASKTSAADKATELVAPIGGVAPEFKEKAVWPARWMLSLPLYLGAVFLLLVANVVLTTRPGVVTHDSQQFTDALGKVWYPLVLEKQNTPRAAKRFVNRVRYLAMRQRSYRDRASLWERTLFPQRLASPEHAQKPPRIPEPIMIALAAMEQSNPAWVIDQDMFKHIVDGKDVPKGLLAAAREKHIEEFSSSTTSQWTCLPGYREPFLKIWPRLSPEEQAEEQPMTKAS